MKKDTITRCLHHNMAIMGGFFAGYTIFNRVHFLGTAQTNNMIHVIEDICGRNYMDFLLRILALLIYISGTVLYVIITNKTKWNIKFISICVNLAAILIIGFLPEDIDTIMAWYPVFFAASLQWNAFPGAYGHISSTIFCTNNIKQATLSLSEYIVGNCQKRELRDRGFFYITSLLSFEFGVACSYYASLLFGIRSIFCDGFFAIPAFVLLYFERKIAKNFT